MRRFLGTTAIWLWESYLEIAVNAWKQPGWEASEMMGASVTSREGDCTELLNWNQWVEGLEGICRSIEGRTV